MSGGPIVDAEGKVVAIVAGGLKNGTVPASWGWPASQLRSLLASTAVLSNPSRPTSALFSMTKDTSARERRQCGGLEFSKGSTLGYNEILNAADDGNAVRRIAAISARPQSVIDQFRFDVWRHRGSGAAVVVPEGVDLVVTANGCVARSGPFEEIVRGEAAANPAQVQDLTMRFEVEILAKFSNYNWQSDGYLTMIGPTTRADGLVVNRKGAVGVSLSLPRQAHIAETLMARGGTVVGIFAINNNYGPQYQPCIYAPNSAECGRVADELTEFAKFVLAVQLSTYPVY
jgi:hypothetical protein